MVVQAAPVTSSTVVVAVDVGKTEFAFSVTDATRTPLLKPRTGCPMTGPSLAQVVADISRVLPADAVVKVGIEAAGHYHRPLLNAGVAGRLGGARAQPRPCHRATPGAGQAHDQDRRDRPAGDDRAAAGRSRPAGPGPRAGARRAHGMVGAPDQSGGDADGHEEPAARTARSDLPRSDPGAAGRAGHQGRSAGRGRVRRPRPARRAGQQPVHPVRRDPRAADPHDRWPTGWSRQREMRCPPRTPRSPVPSWPPTSRCSPTSMRRSTRPPSSWPGCCP